MSKPVLPIHIAPDVRAGRAPRTIEVPCRLPEAFNFKFAGHTYTAVLKFGGHDGLSLQMVDWEGFTPSEDEYNEAGATAEAIFADAKGALGLLGPDGRQPVALQPIALAYEAECAAHEAHVRALQAMPLKSLSTGLIPPHPDDTVAGGIASPAARMLAKYVEYVFEQAVKAHEVKP